MTTVDHLYKPYVTIINPMQSFIHCQKIVENHVKYFEIMNNVLWVVGENATNNYNENKVIFSHLEASSWFFSKALSKGVSW